jgi:protein TonB
VPVRQEEKKTVREEAPARASASWLNERLVDGDESSNRNARRARRKALGVSILAQAALLSALVIVPLLATVAVPQSTVLTPILPYARLGSPTPRVSSQPHATLTQPLSQRPTYFVDILTPPGMMRPGSGRPNSTEAENVGPPNLGPGNPNGVPDGVPNGLVPTEPIVRRPEVVEPPKPEIKRARISEGVQEAMLIHRVEPRYPPLAVQTRLQGTVHLHAIVGTNGVIRDLQLLDGHILLGRAALEAVAQWRYRPTILNGEPVEVDTYITVVFKLGQ